MSRASLFLASCVYALRNYHDYDYMYQKYLPTQQGNEMRKKATAQDNEFYVLQNMFHSYFSLK